MTDKNAILVIDMQNDFVLPGACLEVAGAMATVPEIANFLAYGRSHGWPVIYIIRAHHPSGCDAEKFRKSMFLEKDGFCVENSEGAKIIKELTPKKDDLIIKKYRFSAFFDTILDLVLRDLKIERLYITGTQYPNCVRSTAVDALSLGYETVICTDCCSAATDEVARANIFDLKNMGISCEPSVSFMK